MKYCSHCGAELFNEAVVCPKCGCMADSQSTANVQPKFSACAIVGFVLSLVSLIYVINFFGLLGFAGMGVSIGGLVSCNKHGYRGKGLAIAGIVVGAVTGFFGFIIWIYAFAIINAGILALGTM